MKDDPPIDAIRKVRHEISAAVGHDTRRLIEYYRERQKAYGDRVVNRRSGTSQPVDEDAA